MKKSLLFLCLIIILSNFLFILYSRTHNNLGNINLVLPRENIQYLKLRRGNTNNQNQYNGIIPNSQQYIFSKLYDSKLQEYDKSNYYYIDILDKKYSCQNHNCYDFATFMYDKKNKDFLY